MFWLMLDDCCSTSMLTDVIMLGARTSNQKLRISNKKTDGILVRVSRLLVKEGA